MTLLGGRFSAARAHAGLLAVVALFLVIGLVYAVAAPVFEKPDEPQHFFFVREIAERHGLPVQQPGQPTRWQQEGSQPPLYYLAAALLTAGFDASDWQAISATNPYAVQGDPQTPGNRNVYLHTADDQFPGRGAALAVYAVRIVSLLFGAGSLLVTYQMARAVFPVWRGVATTAVALHAFLPQFLFVASAASNDAFAALACGLVLWQSVRIVQGASRVRDDLWLGVLVGAAALSKLSGAEMGLVAALAIVYAERRRLAGIVRRGLLSGAVAALVAGWWYARNLALYGDITGLNRMLAIVGVRNPPPDLWQLLDETEGLRLSFWGLFGWFSILLPMLVYVLFDGLALVAVGGLLLGAVRFMRSGTTRRALTQAPSLSLAAVTAFVVLVGVLRWGALTPGLQGRLLFPALPALALLGSAGLHAWFDRRVWRWAIAGALVVMAGVAVWAPIQVIAPQYARPALLEASASRPLLRFGERIDLMAVTPEVITARPGDEVSIELRWQAREPLDRPYTLYIKVFGVDDELIAATDTYPGSGMFPTTQWPTGRLSVDRYRLRISPAARAPVAGKVVIGWYDRSNGAALAPFNADDQRVVRPTVARLNVLPVSTARPVPVNHLDARFGEMIALRGYDFVPGGITLYWEALHPLDADYTVFIHALDRDGRIIAQRDAQPRGGWYPTSAWLPGYVVKDDILFAWPPETDRLAIGLYTFPSGTPLRIDQQDHFELSVSKSRN